MLPFFFLTFHKALPAEKLNREILPPQAGCRSPKASLSNVLLPAPLAPRTAQCCPARISQLIFRSTSLRSRNTSACWRRKSVRLLDDRRFRLLRETRADRLPMARCEACETSTLRRGRRPAPRRLSTTRAAPCWRGWGGAGEAF